jgi:hypothetical protein
LGHFFSQGCRNIKKTAKTTGKKEEFLEPCVIDSEVFEKTLFASKTTKVF